MNDNLIDKCPVCGFDSFKVLGKYRENHLVRCGRCTFVFSNIRPTEDDLYRTYAAYERGSNYPTNATLAKLRARVTWLCGQANVRTVLDVGCGDGHFLAMFAEAGCKTYGSEFDRDSSDVARSKGAVMLDGGLTPSLPEGVSGVDVVVFTEVIEHINNPLEVLRYFCKILNKGGLLYITTPNFDGLERRLLGPNWGMIRYPEHISYYSPSTLDEVVCLAGMSKMRTRTENISLFRIIQFINRMRKAVPIDAEGVSSQAQKLVSENKVLGILKSAINGVLHVTNLGSSIVAVYRKH